MATPRVFNDWSPASVFGPTATSPVPREDHRSEETNLVGTSNAQLCSPPNADDDQPAAPQRPPHKQRPSHTMPRQFKLSPRRPTTTATMRKEMAKPEQDDEEAEASESKDHAAARVLQTKLRLWLLYKKERESIDHVQQLRAELHRAAATAISDWILRSHMRFRIQQRAAQLRHLRVVRQGAAQCIHKWIHHQRAATQMRSKLRRRMDARRCLYCWWRRLLCERRCRRRHEHLQELQTHARTTAQQLICRRVWAFSVRRKTEQQTVREARACINEFLTETSLRRRAKREAARRRRHHLASTLLLRALHIWHKRRGLLQWRATVKGEREAELARHHLAACVLQRLIRVVLTAFRLLRRRDAVLHIQRIVRGHLARRLYAILVQQRHRQAAVHIQRLVRGFLARRIVARLLHKLRERFKCLNCGLIEPGGRYCKFCGRKRTTFDVLVSPGVAAGTTTTDAKLRKKREKLKHFADNHDVTVPEYALPPAPASQQLLGGSYQARKAMNGLSIGAAIVTMGLPDLVLPPPASPTKTNSSTALPRVLASPRQPLASPLFPPHKPTGMRASRGGVALAGGRPSHLHRSLSAASSSLPVAGLASVDKTRQRADALLQNDRLSYSTSNSHSSAMNLHLQRLQKAGKAASR